MSSQAELNRSQFYSDLNKLGQTGEYDRAVKICNKVLHNFPDDTKVFHYRIVCLIQLSKFEEALSSISKHPNQAKDLLFEKAYCQYRLNLTEDALQTIESSEKITLQLKELKAQLLYRLERFEECLDLYRDIIKNSNDSFDDERQTNLSAVTARLAYLGKKVDPPPYTNESYELAYNIACQLIGQGQIVDAENKLKKAEKLCLDYFDEDTPASEIEEESAIIRAQLAFCYQKQGKDKEAKQIYKSILAQKPDDIALSAVVCNNSVALNKDQNLFDSKKKIKIALSDAADQKLTSLQKEVIAVNNCLLSIYTSQGSSALTLCDKLVEKYPNVSSNIDLMKAVVLDRDKKRNDAISLLKSRSKNSKRKIDIHLAIAQLLLNGGNIEEAITSLQNMGDDKFKPGITGLLVSLNLELKKTEDASNILEKAVAWHQNNKDTTQGDLTALWRHAADLHLRSGKPDYAAKSLEELLLINPNDSTTLAQLIIACARYDPMKAKQLSERLPHLVDLTPQIDIETLETSNWAMGLKVIKRATKVHLSPGAQTPSAKKKRKNKKRKGPLPKNYDPNVPPDPERWLPRRERSTYRRKKDKRNRDVGKGTQGGSSASEQFDFTTKTLTPRPAQSESLKQRKEQPRKNLKKKKGK